MEYKASCYCALTYYQHMKRMKVLANAKRLESLPEEKYNNLIEKEYLKVFGNILDWNNLRTYTEKMQWEKIYNKKGRTFYSP